MYSNYISMNNCSKINLEIFSKQHYTYINQIFGDKTIREIIKEMYAPRDWDFVVEDATEEFEYSKRLYHPENAAKAWEEVLIKIYKNKPSINKKSFKIKKILENKIIEYAENLIYKKKMKERNIQGWGKEQYYKLTK